MATAGHSTKRKWKPIFLVQVYRMARLGLTDTDICKDLNISRDTFYRWQDNHSELKEAICLAKKELSDGQSFPDWLYSRLSPELKHVWDQIRKFEKTKNGIARIELLLQDEGKQVRQQLFLYALCVSRFSPSIAMRKLNLTKRELDNWVQNDPGFSELMEEIQWHKANFFEESLVKLVQQGNPAAVVFANKTYNNNRGYSSHSQVDVNVSGQIMHGVVDLSELMPYLTETSKLELLDAIRKKEECDVTRSREVTPYEAISNTIASLPAEL